MCEEGCAPGLVRVNPPISFHKGLNGLWCCQEPEYFDSHPVTQAGPAPILEGLALKKGVEYEAMGLFCWMLVSRKIHVLSPEATKVAQLCSVLEVLNFGFSSRDK